MFIIKVHKSVLVTYLGVICAAISMYFAFAKIAFADVPVLRFSLIFLMLSGICDMFDGKVARMCKRTDQEKEFGIQIDSLADTFNFIVLPVVIMLSLGMNAIWDFAIFAFFIMCGISRLAFFNVNASLDNPVKYYSGLPVTATAVIYPLLGLLHGNIPEVSFKVVYMAATLTTALLFVLKIKVPKFKGVMYIIIPALAVILGALLLVIR